MTLLGVSTTAVAAPLNPVYKAEEYRSSFETIGVSFLTVPAGGAPAARAVAAKSTHLRFICAGAAAEVEALFGVPLLATYGMTGAAPALASMRRPPCRAKARIGRIFMRTGNPHFEP